MKDDELKAEYWCESNMRFLLSKKGSAEMLFNHSNWKCYKCKKECKKEDLSELVGWGVELCNTCINKFLEE